MEKTMNQKIKITRFDLSKRSCDTARKFGSIELAAEKSRVYEDAVANLDIIDMMWEKGFNVNEVFTLMAGHNGLDIGSIPGLTGKSSDEAFDADEKNLLLKTAQEANRLTRYILDEQRLGRENLMKLYGFPQMDVPIGNYDVAVRPQALFKEKSAGITKITAVFYAFKPAPVMTTGTFMEEIRKAEKKGADHEKRRRICSIWLNQYCALKYVQQLLATPELYDELELPEGTKVVAEGAVYYLQFKNYDDKISSFFGEPKSIVMMQEEMKVGEDVSRKTDEDKIFEQYAEEHELGTPQEKCTEDDCRWCMHQPSCRFVKSPVLLPKQETGKAAAAEYEPTDEQKEVMKLSEKVTLVIARAGSGKTATAERIVRNLIRDGADPSSIQMITFTNNAVREFKDRVVAKEPKGEQVRYDTFHSFALNCVKEYYKECGFTRAPREINVVDNSRIIDNLLRDQKISGTDKLYARNFSGILNVTAIAVKLFEHMTEHPDEVPDIHVLDNTERAMCDNQTITDLTAVYEDYLKALKEDNVILFSQMEPLFHKLLVKHPEYLPGLGLHYVIIDEFQDISDIQMDTVKMFYQQCLKEDTDRMLCIGDDLQSIYGFRYANVENIIELERKLGARVNILEMLKNWRSTPNILSRADDLVSLNQEQTGSRSVAGRPAGEDPVVQGFHSEEEEYKFIVSEILKNHEAGTAWDQQAFIARTNKELAHLAAYLSEAGIPYVFKAPVKYADNSRVKAAAAFTRNVFWAPETTEGYYAYLAAKYDGDMLDTMSPGQIKMDLAELYDKFRNIDQMDLNAQKALWKTALDEIRGSDEVYASFLDDYVFSYPEIEEELQFFADFQKYGQKMAVRMTGDYEGVVLVTAHSAKGLEWEIVYNSVSQYDSPVLHWSSRHDEVEETRRLFYVSMTRAKNKLYVTGQYIVPGTKSTSKKDGGPTYNQFLQEIIELSGQVYDPTDPKEAEKRAERQAKAKARREAAGSKEMTEEEKARYNKRVRGSYQEDMSSFLKSLSIPAKQKKA